MVDAGGIGEGGRSTAGEDMDGASWIVAVAAQAEARRQKRWRQPRYEMNKKNS